MSTQSPTANSPGQGPDEPFDRARQDDKPWSPPQREQGKENQAGDQDVVTRDDGEDPSKD